MKVQIVKNKLFFSSIFFIVIFLMGLFDNRTTKYFIETFPCGMECEVNPVIKIIGIDNHIYIVIFYSFMLSCMFFYTLKYLYIFISEAGGMHPMSIFFLKKKESILDENGKLTSDFKKILKSYFIFVFLIVPGYSVLFPLIFVDVNAVWILLYKESIFYSYGLNVIVITMCCLFPVFSMLTWLAIFSFFKRKLIKENLIR